MRVTASDRSPGAGLQCDEHRPAPSFDETHAERATLRSANLRQVHARRQRGENRLHEAARLLDLLEADRHACGHVALRSDDLDRWELIIGLAGQIDARIEPLAARA